MRRNLCRFGFWGMLGLLVGLAAPWGFRVEAEVSEAALRLEVVDQKDWLPDRSAVIVLNNCDASNGGKQPDNADEVINGPDDLKQMTPLRIPRAAVPAGPVELRLGNEAENDPIPPPAKFRLFNDSHQVILGGKKRGDRYELPPAELTRLGKEDLLFYVEGLDFAVQAKLELRQPDAKPQELLLRTAPFLLIPHTQPAKRKQVVRLPPPSPRWKQALEQAKNTLNVRAYARAVQEYEDAVAEADQSELYVEEFKEACQNANIAVEVIVNRDRWIQDEIEWGYTETPRAYLEVAMHMHRDRGLHEYALGDVLKPHIGYYRIPNVPQEETTGLDNGGNLEVTPPTRNYPLGRVYYGSKKSVAQGKERYYARTIHPAYQEFFQRQGVQPPIPGLHTDWLAVGHIDELVTFLPTGNPERPFALLLASPLRALTILDETDPDTALDPNGFRYRHYGHFLETAGDLLQAERYVKKDQFNFLGGTMRSYNLKVDQKIFGLDHDHPDPESLKFQLMQALDLRNEDVHEIPVLFVNSFYDNPHEWNAGALTPGMVNLACCTPDHCIIPKPFLQVFENETKAVLAKLNRANLNPVFIDDWHLYHTKHGEVHCGSNAIRQPFSQKWWTAGKKGTK
ncbi:MAG: protein-arginine deiminase family protein [Gemmataceae bacterium]